MSAYLDNREATEEVMAGAWFGTGDLGRVDEDGHLRITGRSKDLIVTDAGKNVYPDEVEERYGELPFVKELCVFGLPADDGVGDMVHAVIVPDREAAPELDRSSVEREIRDAAAARGAELPTHQRIAALHFWDRELPKTSTMKAKRSWIRDTVAGTTGGGKVRVAAGCSLRRWVRRQRGTRWRSGSNAYPVIRGLVARLSKQPLETIAPRSHLLWTWRSTALGSWTCWGRWRRPLG